MPPKPSTSLPQIADPENEVVCPIKAADGTNCRKKCLGVRLPPPRTPRTPRTPMREDWH